jgi:TonB family protein
MKFKPSIFLFLAPIFIVLAQVGATENQPEILYEAENTELTSNMIEGYSIVSFVINEAGYPESIVIEESTDDKFAKIAEKSVQAWKFEAPLDEAGEPTSVELRTVLKMNRELTALEKAARGLKIAAATSHIDAS